MCRAAASPSPEQNTMPPIVCPGGSARLTASMVAIVVVHRQLGHVLTLPGDGDPARAEQ